MNRTGRRWRWIKTFYVQLNVLQLSILMRVCVMSINKWPQRIPHIFPEDLFTTVMKLCPFAWVINDAAPLPFVPFKRSSHPRDAATAASFIFLRSLYSLLSCLEEAAVTAQFSQCLSDCLRKHHIPAQVEEEVLPGTRHSPSPLSIIPIELVHVSNRPTREESGSSGVAQFLGGVLKRPPIISVMMPFVCIILLKSVSLWDSPPHSFTVLRITTSCSISAPLSTPDLLQKCFFLLIKC